MVQGKKKSGDIFQKIDFPVKSSKSTFHSAEADRSSVRASSSLRLWNEQQVVWPKQQGNQNSPHNQCKYESQAAVPPGL